MLDNLGRTDKWLTLCPKNGVSEEYMATGQSIQRHMYVTKAQAELSSLAQRGVVMSGNAFSSVLMIKGDLSSDERDGNALMDGKDGQALRKALVALGYAPEDWAALSILFEDGYTTLPSALVREAIASLAPATVLILDNQAASVLRDTYGEELAHIEEFEVAMLEPGLIAQVLGMRFLNLGGFAAALQDPQRKQWVWACLKRVPPLGEPY
jgi:hypothetical protein